MAAFAHRRRWDIVAKAGRAAVVLGASFAFAATASAASVATTAVNPTPGPTQLQLERTINGVGKSITTVNGQSLESNQSLTDKQALMAAEQAIITNAELTLPVGKAAEANDARQGGCLCNVVSVTAMQIQINYVPTNGQSPDPAQAQSFSLTDQTVYYDSLTKVTKLDLKPGDPVVVLPDTTFKNAALVMRMKYPVADYTDMPLNISSLKSAHRADGKCFNNESDQCPDLFDPVNLMTIGDWLTVPDGAEVREAYGQITALADYSMELTNPSGSVWKLNIGRMSFCCSLGQTDSGLRLGYYVRVEFWQMKSDLASRTVFDESQAQSQMNLTKDQARQLLAEGKIALNPKTPLRAVQYVAAKPYVTPSGSPRP
jgi:hypothetical protein